MIVADLVRFAALITIPIAAVFGNLHLPQLYAVALIAGIGSAFFAITYQAYLPAIVSSSALSGANVKLELSNSGSKIAGNALAGILVQSVGAAAALAVDACSYLISVASLVAIRERAMPHDRPPLSMQQAVDEIAEGLRAVVHSDLRWIAGATATTNLGGAMISAVMLIYAYRILHLQPGPLGVMYGIAETGFAGALLSSRIRRLLGLRLTLIGALLLGASGTMLLLFAPLGLPYVILFCSTALVGLSIPIYNVNQVSYRQTVVDVRMQGRLNATMRTFVWGTLPLGAFTGGYLGTHIGVPATIATGATLNALAALWLLPFRERTRNAAR